MYTCALLVAALVSQSCAVVQQVFSPLPISAIFPTTKPTVQTSCPLFKCASPTPACFVAPCSVASCPAYPNAQCCAGCTCNAFFISPTGATLDCNPSTAATTVGTTTTIATKPDSTVSSVCPRNTVCTLACTTNFVDQCSNGATCPAYPDATCCRGCCGAARFYDKNATLVDCNPCKLPITPGPCKAAFRRFGFSAAENKCVEFTYGGCGGNANNFDSQAACDKQCSDRPQATLPPVTGSIAFTTQQSSASGNTTCGSCLDKQVVANRCEFLNRTVIADNCGCAVCGGNTTCGACPDKQAIASRCDFLNRTVTTDNCGCAVCGGASEMATARPNDTISVTFNTETPKNPCLAAIDAGTGKAFFTSFGFDGKDCVKFVFTGGAGNGNRFDTIEACRKQCGVTVGVTVDQQATDEPASGAVVPTLAAAIVAGVALMQL